MALRFETLRGDALHSWLPALARLRITVFRDWPYLYEGDEAYEARYLRAYAEAAGAAVFVALDGETPVGAATCEPMGETHAEVREAFLAAGRDPAKYCYFGESILLPQYRGQGAGVRFFDLREGHARALGLPRTTFCGVRRAADDPRRPASYTPLDGFWRKRGYTPCPGLSCTLTWQEIGAAEETPHILDFWERILP
ncbi:GNAT family N-acetyltransferase [Roseomonas marmotae]|uniref:GNAT family N-acetyltransferase n=1 Tax=Roseomonas marmotae TaxID=2768161 RepID=A0ABS3KBF9_9PROT|nr:GNAT family N-acetyltransferase [Roseomonas marmotae]MBO1073983.1 GNAT family N-acetyltransferase [Roseomonas marmotae]QTI78775.1 GNAT family N-acetyltransferase [Roseomonas marmotae]